uniref:Ig-like domain-containing protein n=1 Tax=Pseudomonas mucidolens TaxID=46679 RepID=UPI0030D78146
MENITIVDKATGTTTEHAFGNTSLNGTGIVKLPFGPESVQSFQQSGQNLVVTLKTGETITIQNFFVVGADGATSQLVMTNPDGTLLLGNYSSPYSGFTFSEVSSLDDLVGAGVLAESSTPSWVLWGLGLLGVGIAAAALDGGSGGGGGGGGGATSPPGAATDLSVSADGLSVIGKGQPGTTVIVRDAAGNVIGSGTVGADGNFQVGLDTPRTNGETLEVVLKDSAGNESPPSTVVAGDTSAPEAPADLVISEDGTTVSGKGEPGATVTIKDAAGNVIGTGPVDVDGNFQVTLDPPQVNGETLEVTLSDPAGNESQPGTVVAGDTTAPDAPTDLLVGEDGTTVSGKGEPGTTVTIKDAAGNVIGTGPVDVDGNFQVTLDPPQVNGETLEVTLSDPAGNESQPGTVVAGDTTAPDAPTDLLVGEDGTTVSGKGEPGTTVTIKDAAGNVIGTGPVDADGNFQVTLDPPQVNGETLEVTLSDPAGNESQPGTVVAGDTTA